MGGMSVSICRKYLEYLEYLEYLKYLECLEYLECLKFGVGSYSKLHRKAALISTRQKVSLNDFVMKAIAYAVEHEKDIDGDLVAI